MKRIVWLAIMALWGVVVSAQDVSAGQLCIRAYEDRNANSTFDAGEPFITKDVSVALANADGLIVKTALLEDSPRASQGLVCFQQLEAGQYTAIVTSASFLPTTNTAFVAGISQTSVPQVFDYGAQVYISTLPVLTPSPSNTLSTNQVQVLLQRIGVGAIGAGIVVVIMSVLGVVLYWLFVRPAKPTLAEGDTGRYMPPTDR